MVLVFKTSVDSAEHLESLRPFMDDLLKGEGRWTLDLTDSDRVLRVEHPTLTCSQVEEVLQRAGHQGMELPD